MYRWQLDCKAHFGFLQISSQCRPSIGGRRQFGAVWELLLKATAKHACVPLCHGSDRGHRSEAKALRLPVTLIPASLNFFAIPWHIITALALLNLFFGCPCLPEPLTQAKQGYSICTAHALHCITSTKDAGNDFAYTFLFFISLMKPVMVITTFKTSWLKMICLYHKH